VNLSSEDLNSEELEDDSLDLAEEISLTEIALTPADTGDPAAVVEEEIPKDIRSIVGVCSSFGRPSNQRVRFARREKR
jgi:hypothetical protein